MHGELNLDRPQGGQAVSRKIAREKTPHTGIYKRTNRDGSVVYDYNYKDSSGALRWGTARRLMEAKAAREELNTRRRKGDQIVRSKLTLAEVIEEYLPRLPRLGDRTRENYEASLRLHVTPLIGRVKISSLTRRDVADVIREMERKQLSASSVSNALKPLSRVCALAIRDGLLAANPVRALDRDERPRQVRRPVRVLTLDEIHKLLDASTTDRTKVLHTAAILSGLRQSELLGLAWRHIDMKARVIKVERQLGRSGEFINMTKTESGMRDVHIGDDLVSELSAYKLSLPPACKAGDALVFAGADGQPLGQRAVAMAFSRTLVRAGITRADGKASARFHDMRSTFASIEIANGLDVVFLSKQLGHSDPSITLKRYSNLFQAEKHADKARAALDGVIRRNLG